MIVMGCNSGGVKGGEGKVNLEAKNSFLESLVKIGEGFQEIFASFGNAVGDVFGFGVVKSGDKRSKVGEHFDKIGKGLQVTKDKLDYLSKEIVSNPHTATKGVEVVINSASKVIAKLIGALTKLAGVTNDSAVIGESATDNAIGAAADDVNVVIAGVKEIIEVAKESGVKIGEGDSGGPVAGGANTAGIALEKLVVLLMMNLLQS